MLNFTQPVFDTLAALSWAEDLLPDSKNESKFVTSILCRKWLFSAIELLQLM